MEYDELSKFFRLDDSWDPEVDEDRPAPASKPIGVPGASPASTPLKPRVASVGIPSTPTATPLKGKNPVPDTPVTAPPAGGAQAPPPTPANKREGEKDLGDELVGYGLQGVKVTDDDLLALVEELGLGGDEADEFVKGLGGGETKRTSVAKDA